MSFTCRKKPIIISIEGSIGTGKSTVLSQLEKEGIYCAQEGADDQNRWGDILHHFYHNKKRWSFTLQIAILNDMARQYDNFMKLKEDVIIVERSPLSALTFVKNAIENDFLTPTEQRIYLDLHKKISWIPDIIISLEVDPSIAFKRIQNRNRKAETENNISMSYIRSIDSLYRQELNNWKKMINVRKLKVKKIYRVDASYDKDTIKNSIMEIIKAHK